MADKFANLIQQLQQNEAAKGDEPQAPAHTQVQHDGSVVGLGMSGGGFRASLYHLGSLSVLAEADALRNIELISTVSGGSIIGVHFFLRLRQLLQSKPDTEITREDYMQVVEDVTTSFVRKVSNSDSYWGSFLNPLSNFYIRMNGGKKVRIEKIVELLEASLYSQYLTEEERANKTSLENLRIVPPDEDPSFCPYQVNHRRKAKIPVLLINATCLNSGHRFVFASDAIPPPRNIATNDARYWSYEKCGGWCGEIIDPKFSSVAQLPALKYRHLSDKARATMTLATAAASSAAVPLIFDGVSIDDMYRTRPRYRVVLVDGSISDNTGLETLRDCGATTIILSDGGVEVQEDEKVSYRQNPIALTSRSIDLLMTQSQQDRLLAMLRSRSIPLVHISLAFDRRFRQVALQSKLNANILQGAQSIALKSGEVEALMKRLNLPSPAPGAEEPAGNGASVHDLESLESTRRDLQRMDTIWTEREGSIFRRDSNVSSEAPLPKVNQHVLTLVGSMRTHLDLFSEVECYFVMGVAFLEAALQLSAEQEKIFEDTKLRNMYGRLPWSEDHLRRVAANDGYEWAFKKLLPFLSSGHWEPRQRSHCVPCMVGKVENERGELDIMDDINDDGEAEEKSRSKYDSDPAFAKLITDLGHQMRAAAVVWPRVLKMYPRAGRVTAILVVLGFFSGLVALIVIFAETFYDHHQRSCTREYRESVWFNAFAQVGIDFDFLTIVEGGDSRLNQEACEQFVIIDGGLLEQYPDWMEFVQYVQWQYDPSTDTLLEGQGSFGKNAWAKPIVQGSCTAWQGPSLECVVDDGLDTVELDEADILVFDATCLDDEERLMSTGGLATCEAVLTAVQDNECESWNDTQISRTAIFLLTFFGVLFCVFSVIMPAILFGLFLFPLAAIFDQYV